MPVMFHGTGDAQVHPILGAIKTIGVSSVPNLKDEVVEVQPFITISRQAGAGGIALANALVEHLNRVDPGERLWSVWDRELVQKVAQEHHIAQTLVDTLEDRGQSWLEELLGGLRISDTPDSASELRVFWKTATTVRAIAQVGRCVIVGRGGAFITHNMKGGLHIRLIAPVAWRIRNFASLFKLSIAEAESRVHELDRNREAFYRRHWPTQVLNFETFAATFNTAAVGERELVQAVAAMIPGRR